MGKLAPRNATAEAGFTWHQLNNEWEKAERVTDFYLSNAGEKDILYFLIM